ncbi:hypothetical protein Tco_0995744 [Tanacetum coccineum]
MTTRVIPELEKEVAIMGPRVNKRRCKRASDEARSSKETTPVISSEHVATTEAQGQTLVESPETGKSTSFLSMDGSPGDMYQPKWGMTNNCRLDTPDMCQDIVDHIVPPGYFSELCHLSNTDFFSQYNVNLVWQVAMGSQLRLRFEQEARLLKKATAKITKQDQRIQAREEYIKKLKQETNSLRTVDTEVQGLRNQAMNLETLLEAEVDMKKAAEAKNAKLTKELESLRTQFTDLQVSNNQLSQQVSTLQAQVIKKEKSLDYNNSFLREYECSSLALDRVERRDEKEEIGSLETR